MTGLSFPRSRAPMVSLIVVTFNALDWTKRSLAASLEHTETEYELIVIDNASSDGTRAFLRQHVHNATLVFNERNLGFGVAANQGADRARAPVLVFLNSDLLVTAGWLGPLMTRLRNDPRAGAVGPRILSMDHRLDHAGALLAYDGSTHHYGSGDDPSRVEYLFPRECDYVTGACMAVRTRLFRELGGFDPWFQIAYFEDTDFCLRLAQAGHAVVYEPASVVLHEGGASSTKETTQELLRVNHPRFHHRWRTVLDHRPRSPLAGRPERAIAARDVTASGTVLLLCDDPASTRALAMSLLAGSPRLRITIACRRAHPELDEILRFGIELVIAPSHDWFAARRFHYDVAAGSDPALDAMVAATQPQAVRLTGAELPGNLPGALAAAGIA